MGFPANVRVRDRMAAISAACDSAVFVSNHFSHNGGLSHDAMEALARPAGFLVACGGMELAV